MCIFNTWRCDGDKDCSDGSDEKNCTEITASDPKIDLPFPVFPKAPNCNEWTFQCRNDQCIPYWWKCDGSEDCADGSDELECGNDNSNSLTSTTTEDTEAAWRPKCSVDKFQCPGEDGECIWEAWLCDGEPDCPGQEDESEAVCQGRPRCTSQQFRCERSGQCVNYEQVCDGHVDCTDGSDESLCHEEEPHPVYENTCVSGQFECDGTCHDVSKMCDGVVDCQDASDELLCDYSASLETKGLEVLENHVTATSVMVQWWMPDISNAKHLEFQPGFSPKGAVNQWKFLEWRRIDDFAFNYTGLRPFTTYEFKINVRDLAKNMVHNATKIAIATTLPDVPSAPSIFNLRQEMSEIILEWTKPAQANGNLISYIVETTSNRMKSVTETSGLETKMVVDATTFKPGET